MSYFRQLPLSLKVIGLVGLLLYLAALALSLSLFAGLPKGLILLELNDFLMHQFAIGLVLLGSAFTTPIAWYILGSDRDGEIARDTSRANPALLSVALLAILPLVMLGLALFAPTSALTVGIMVGLTILAAVSIVGWIVYFISLPLLSAWAAGSLSGPVGTPASAAANRRDSAARTDSASSGRSAPTPPSTQNPTPFKMGWWSFDLGQYRPCDGTYCFYPYESIPPILALDGTLAWLGPLDPQTDQQMGIHRNAPEARGQLAQIEAEATKLDLTLPEAFVRLMGSPELQDRIPSCTACTFGFGAHIIPCVGVEKGQAYLIRFLNDQQDVLIWYLFLTPRGDQRVVVTPFEFGEAENEDPDDVPEKKRTSIIAQTVVCAPSFEAFVYRFWLENNIWFKLNAGDGEGKLTDEERRYLAHYGRATS
jgi:hypothetical protein